MKKVVSYLAFCWLLFLSNASANQLVLHAVRDDVMPKGMPDPLVEVTKRAFSNIDVKLVVHRIPPARGYKYFLEENLDVFLARIDPTQIESLDYYFLPQSYSTLRFFAYCLKDSPCDFTDENLIGAYIRGYDYIANWVDTLSPERKKSIVSFVDTERLVKALLNKRVDFIFLDEQSMFGFDLTNSLAIELQRKTIPLKNMDYGIVLKNQYKYLSAPLSASLKKEIEASPEFQRFPVLNP